MAEKKKEVRDIVPEVKPVSQSPMLSVPAELLEKAITANATIETIERLVALQERAQDKWAKKQFESAMAKLQSKIPVVKKQKHNGGTQSNYAPLEDIVEQVRSYIAKEGFTYRWDTDETADGKIVVHCYATHEDGHTESSRMSSKISEGTKANSEPQKVAITITYLKRYTLCNIFAISVAGEDMDARMKSNADVNQDPSQWKDKLDAATGIQGLQVIWANTPVWAKVLLESHFKELARGLDHRAIPTDEDKPNVGRPDPYHPNKITK